MRKVDYQKIRSILGYCYLNKFSIQEFLFEVQKKFPIKKIMFQKECSNCYPEEDGEDCGSCRNINPKLIKSHQETLMKQPNYIG